MVNNSVSIVGLVFICLGLILAIVLIINRPAFSRFMQRHKNLYSFILTILTLSAGAGFFLYGQQIFKTQKVKEELITLNDSKKSDIQNIAEIAHLADEGIKSIKEQVKRRRLMKDSLMKSREAFNVYQIGHPMEDKQVIFDLYQKIKDSISISIETIGLFEVERNQFILFYNANKLNKIDSIQYSNVSLIRSQIKKIDLLSMCKFEEDVVQIKSLRHRKFAFTIPVYRCKT